MWWIAVAGGSLLLAPTKIDAVATHVLWTNWLVQDFYRICNIFVKLTSIDDI